MNKAKEKDEYSKQTYSCLSGWLAPYRGSSTGEGQGVEGDAVREWGGVIPFISLRGLPLLCAAFAIRADAVHACPERRVETSRRNLKSKGWIRRSEVNYEHYVDSVVCFLAEKDFL